jgi:hypothetical protein
LTSLSPTKASKSGNGSTVLITFHYKTNTFTSVGIFVTEASVEEFLEGISAIFVFHTILFTGLKIQIRPTFKR